MPATFIENDFLNIMPVPFEVTLSIVQTAVEKQHAEINVFSKRKDQSITSDEQIISRSLYDALLSLDALVEDIAQLDRYLVRCDNRWWPTKVVLASLGDWQSIEDHIQNSKSSLLQHTEKTKDIWIEARAHVNQALEHAMALSIDASKLHGLQVQLEIELSTIQDLLQASISKAQDSLKLTELEEEEKKAELAVKVKELSDLDWSEWWADLGSGAWQGWWEGLAEGATKNAVEAGKTEPPWLESFGKSVAESSKKSQAQRKLDTQTQRDALKKQHDELHDQAICVREQLGKFKNDQASYNRLVPQFKSSQTEISKIRSSAREFEVELASHKAQAAQAVVKTEHVLAHWETIQYSESREEILEVVRHVINTFAHQALDMESSFETPTANGKMWGLSENKARYLIERIVRRNNEICSLTPMIDGIVAKSQRATSDTGKVFIPFYLVLVIPICIALLFSIIQVCTVILFPIIQVCIALLFSIIQVCIAVQFSIFGVCTAVLFSIIRVCIADLFSIIKLCIALLFLYYLSRVIW